MTPPFALGLTSVTTPDLGLVPSTAGSTPVVVAIDGTSGSGKSTTAKAVATSLNGHYVDTGAMYRAVAWWMLRNGIDVSDADAVANAAQGVAVDVHPEPTNFTVTCAGIDVTAEVRDVSVTEAVSQVAAVPAVRTMLCAYQRELAQNAMADSRSIVMEGRDIGSVVLPDADVKVWLTADVDARAARRANDGEGPVAETSARLKTRDERDASRPISPAQMAPTAVLIDTTDIGVDVVVCKVLDLVNTATGARD